MEWCFHNIHCFKAVTGITIIRPVYEFGMLENQVFGSK